MSNVIKHFRKICRHKYEVCKVCFKFGLYWQGIVHDLSKFSIKEFFTSVKYYQGTSSPIDAEKKDKGYSEAWLHHFHRNKHHWMYWVDFNSKQELTPVKIPYKYALETIADWIGAGKAYQGKNYNYKSALEFYKKNIRVSNKVSEKIFNFQTRQLWDTIMVDLYEHGLDFVVCLVKKGVYEAMYNTQKDNKGNYVIPNLSEYNELVAKYYTD